MNKKVVLVVIILVALGIGAWVFLMNSGTQPENSGPGGVAAPPAAPPQNENRPPEDATETPSAQIRPEGSRKEFAVSGQNFSFTPSAMTVRKGDMVRITFTSGDMMHDLKIDELDVATKVLRAGEQETIEFVADAVGAFEYYCSVGKHREMGMKGMFAVTE